MAEAFGWGALGASALLAGALIAYLLAPGRRVIAVVMALGTGLLIGSVAYELVDDALEHQAVAAVALAVLVGAAVFTAGDWLLDHHGGDYRKDATGALYIGVPGDRGRVQVAAEGARREDVGRGCGDFRHRKRGGAGGGLCPRHPLGVDVGDGEARAGSVQEARQR